MVGKPLLIGGLVLLAVKAFASAKAFQGFNYALGGFPTVSYEGGGAAITFPLVISNSSAQSFVIKGISADAFINGQFVGRIESTESFVISGGGVGNPKLRVTVYLSNAAISLISGIASGTGSGVTVRLTGGIDTSTIRVPLDVTKKF